MQDMQRDWGKMILWHKICKQVKNLKSKHKPDTRQINQNYTGQDKEMKQTVTLAKSRLNFFTVAANSSLSFVSFTYNQKVEIQNHLYHCIDMYNILKFQIFEPNLQAKSTTCSGSSNNQALSQ